MIFWRYYLASFGSILFCAASCSTVNPISTTQKKEKTEKLVYSIIEKRQRAYLKTKYNISNDSALVIYKSQIENSPEAIKEIRTEELSNYEIPRTNYESIFQRTQLSRLEKEANPILKKYNIDTTQVFYSNILCDCFDTETLPLEAYSPRLKNYCLIEINDAFNAYLNNLGIFTTSLTPLTGKLDSISLDSNQYVEHLNDSNNFILFYNFGSFLLADMASIPFHPSLDSMSYEKCNNFHLLSSISSGMQNFNLFHELAHIILGHIANINKLSFVGGSDNSSNSNTIPVSGFKKYEYEYEADSLALILLLDRSGRSKINLLPSYYTVNTPYSLAPLIFFSYVDAFQKFEKLNLGTSRGSQNHPSAEQRRARLLKLYSKLNIIIPETQNYASLIDNDIKILYAYYTSPDFSKSKSNMQRLNKHSKQCKITPKKTKLIILPGASKND